MRPKWSTPASNSEERPAWLGDDLQCYTVPSVTNSCNLPEIEIRGQGQSQGRSQGRSGEHVSLFRTVTHTMTYQHLGQRDSMGNGS